MWSVWCLCDPSSTWTSAPPDADGVNRRSAGEVERIYIDANNFTLVWKPCASQTLKGASCIGMGSWGPWRNVGVWRPGMRPGCFPLKSRVLLRCVHVFVLLQREEFHSLKGTGARHQPMTCQKFGGGICGGQSGCRGGTVHHFKTVHEPAR